MTQYYPNFALLLALFLLPSTTLNAQTLISSFTWEVSPTTAVVGPNATSASSSVLVDINGAGGTRGANPGLPKADMNITVPGATFDVDGCHIICDYQREENSAHFAYRGNSLRFGISGGKVYVQYRLQDGGSFKQHSQSNIYTVPNDDTFRTYEFQYKPTTGRAEVLVNGVSQWANLGSETPGVNMYWSGAGDMVIGDNMDGNGSNKTTLDNWFFYDLSATVLPIELSAFTADLNYSNHVDLNWETSTEVNNDYFTIERSADGRFFEAIAEVAGNGTTTTVSNYTFSDTELLNGTVYYRLKQTDYDGAFTYSRIAAVSREAAVTTSTVSVYPNPASKHLNVDLSNFPDGEPVSIRIVDLTGKQLLAHTAAQSLDGTQHCQLDIANVLSSGMYVVSIETASSRHTQTLMVY